MSNQIEFHCFQWNELNNNQIYQLLKLRSAVFVVEQKCLFEDMDNNDAAAYHLLGINSSNEVVAYSRLFGPNIIYKEGSIGRVCTPLPFRRLGLGKLLMQESLMHFQSLFPNIPIRIMAQLYLRKFYENYGFIGVSEIFIEDDIEHIYMVKPVD